MGKSSGKKKKANSASGEGATKVDPDDAVFLKRAHELKDEGNRRFQAKDYMGALDIYDQALKLTPEGHPDRAVFHSNRAACLLQVKPVIYDNVIMECTLALEAHPKFGKALFRRARAYEAMGKLQLALADVQFLLQSESSNQEALELGKRLRAALGNIEGAQQDTQWRSSVSLHASPPDTATSPATPGADGAPPQSGRGPTLPARPPGKKKGRTTTDSEATLRTAGETGSSVPAVTHNTPQPEISKSGGCKVASNNPVNRDEKKVSKRSISREEAAKQTPRPLKLVFGHDIRRAEVFGNCGFGDLREVVRKRFPGLKTVLIKYQDPDGDLVTITSREELRLAEAAADEAGRSKKQDAGDTPVPDTSEKQVPVPILTSVPELVRLHLVECTPEQEPPIPEDDEIVILEEDDVIESLGEDMATESLEVLPDSEKDVTLPEDGQVAEAKTSKSAKKEDGQPAGEEMEIDDWLFDFAQLFRTHVGIDPDGHVDFHELGMELCSEALEAAVTSDEAQPLFEAAAAKFQEVAALALFNWGNVYMCAARKRMPMEEAGGKPESKDQLQAAFEWAESHYKLAGQKYEEALRIKPDFYEGVLALGQEKFESAKLQWAAAVAGGVDLKSWDSSETLSLYHFAEERMQTAAEMWEQLEAQQQGAEATSKVRKEQVKPETSNDDGASASEAADQGAAMRSQINLFWGNVLFEHSQVEYRLGLNTWRSLLDVAVEKFVAAGASAEEIEGALKNHPANLAKESTENSLPSDEPNTSVGDNNGNSLDPVNENGLLTADEDTKAIRSTVTSSDVQVEPMILAGDAPGKVAKDTEGQRGEDLPETASIDREDGQGSGGDGPSSKAISDDGLVDTPLEDSSTKSNKKGTNSSAASGSHKASTEDKSRPKRAEKKRSQGS